MGMYLEEEVSGLVILAPELLAHRLQLVRHKQVVVQGSDAGITFREHHLHQVDGHAEEWPLVVHATEDGDVPGLTLQRLAQSISEAQPNRQMKSCLRPREDPGDGSE